MVALKPTPVFKMPPILLKILDEVSASTQFYALFTVNRVTWKWNYWIIKKKMSHSRNLLVSTKTIRLVQTECASFISVKSTFKWKSGKHSKSNSVCFVLCCSTQQHYRYLQYKAREEEVLLFCNTGSLISYFSLSYEEAPASMQCYLSFISLS